MAAKRTLRYILPASLARSALQDRIAEAYSISEQPVLVRRSRYYDTFDWRLYRRALSLSREGDEYRLCGIGESATAAAINCRTSEVCRFWWEFPAGDLRASMKSHLSNRALLHLLDVIADVRPLHVANSSGRPFARIGLEMVTVVGKQQPVILHKALTATAVNDHRKEWQRFRQFLRGMGVREKPRSILPQALAAARLQPGDTSSKLNLSLEPAWSTRRSVGMILAHLLRTVRLNEAGLKADIDTEFLHDWRVAVRRTRSALTQIKGVLPADETARFKRDFTRLGRLTNRLRDLDVYLLQKDACLALLPEPFRPGLEPLFERLRIERGRELKAVIDELNSRAYQELMTDWAEFLSRVRNDDLPVTQLSHQPAMIAARRYILQAHRRALRIGRGIAAETDDAQLHRLRIACKKLRYLLEFFSSLFANQDIDPLVKQLKKLQDHLGAFNDLRVQQDDLAASLRQISDGQDSIASAAAIGALAAQLRAEQLAVREKFARVYRDFDSRENEEAFGRLCKLS